MAITQKEIIGLKPKSNAYYVWDDDRTKGVGRLGVKVFSSGSKSFVFRYYRASKRVFIQLGRAPALSLTDARETAKGLGLMLKRGPDPKFELVLAERKREAERKEQESRGSIDLLFKSYTDNMKKEVYPFIASGTKACDVTTDDVVKILAHMIRRGAATQSNRVRSYLHAAFNYGLSHDNDPANYLEEAKFGLAFNPVSSIPKQKSAERVGERYLSYAELHQFMHDIEFDLEGVVASEVMRCLILLCIHSGGQRPYEIAASKWSAINWDNHTLHIPPEISKNKRSHLIPLTASAITILRRQRDSSQDNPFIFPHHTDIHAHVRLDSLSQAIARYRRDHPDFEYFIPRDLRRTCKTLMGELGISKSTRDRLQNHALNDVSSKHYDRYEYLSEKRNALEVWEQKLSGVEVTSENVVSFRANSR